ncbi:Tetrapyrrole methylase [Dillenia turbinata]|uniref:Tetrapyrrole methylase n=1 Tax=Dillenia turbinata TaxID=194707 RepID=A0AAN8VRG7_9MAGN
MIGRGLLWMRSSCFAAGGSNSSDSADSNPSKVTLILKSVHGVPLKPGLYLVGTPIGNLEDITIRPLRVLRSADVILSEDMRHSGKLLQYYNIKTPLASVILVWNRYTIIPIPGPSALVTALSASGLTTDEFSFVGFLPKHAGSRSERLMVAANGSATQIFFVPPHKLHQFLEEASVIFT